jgi:Kef-type K+ transport system membrane component KefB
MFTVVRPVLARLAHWKHAQELNQGVLAAVFVALLVSSLTTEWIGVHAIFGAFLLGAVIPHDSVIARELPEKLQNIIAVLFLPAFFAFTGMRTSIGLVSGLEAGLICGLIILVATLGKFGGTLLASRVTGLPWRESLALGSLMNTRGLMELIVLNIGLDLGVISPTLFAMLVIMALVTTLATTPALHWILGRGGAPVHADAVATH